MLLFICRSHGSDLVPSCCLARLLLESKAHPDYQNSMGDTAMHEVSCGQRLPFETAWPKHLTAVKRRLRFGEHVSAMKHVETLN